MIEEQESSSYTQTFSTGQIGSWESKSVLDIQ